MKEFIEAIKNTNFFKEYIDKLYVSYDTPGIVWFSAKKPYTKMDEIIIGNDLDSYILAGYNLFDSICAFKETDNAIIPYVLKEI